MHRLILSALVLLLYACQQPVESKKEDLKESAIKDYVRMIDSSTYFYDTSSYDYRILKAYVNNDSLFFVKMRDELEKRASLAKFIDIDSCVTLKHLKDLDVDRAYRFKYNEPFCRFGQNITLTRKGDSIQLHFVEYSNGVGHTIKLKDGTKVKPYCTITRDTVKSLTIAQWETFERKIDAADYWGLKPYYHRLILDGSAWQIDAYIKDPVWPKDQHMYSVNRNAPANAAFREIGLYLMKLSGEKDKCGSFN